MSFWYLFYKSSILFFFHPEKSAVCTQNCLLTFSFFFFFFFCHSTAILILLYIPPSWSDRCMYIAFYYVSFHFSLSFSFMIKLPLKFNEYTMFSFFFFSFVRCRDYQILMYTNMFKSQNCHFNSIFFCVCVCVSFYAKVIWRLGWISNST